MASAEGTKTTFQPCIQNRLHQSISSPYIKKVSSSNPTRVRASLRTSQKQPTRISTGRGLSCRQCDSKKPVNSFLRGNKVSRASARQNTFQTLGNPLQECCHLPSPPITRGPTMPTSGFSSQNRTRVLTQCD